MSFHQTSTKCACRPKPWAKPHTASWGSCFSNERLSFIWTLRSRRTKEHNEDKWAGALLITVMYVLVLVFLVIYLYLYQLFKPKGGLQWLLFSMCTHKPIMMIMTDIFCVNKWMNCMIYLTTAFLRKVKEGIVAKLLLVCLCGFLNSNP